MEKQNIDVLIVGSPATINGRGALRYLIDCYVHIFEEVVVLPLSGPLCYFSSNKARTECGAEFPGVVCSDFLEEGKEGKKIADYVRKFSPKNIGCYNVDALSFAFSQSIKDNLRDFSLKEMAEELNQLRMVKSQEEITLCEEAVRLNERVFQAYLKNVSIGTREMDAVDAASIVASKAGCEDQFWMVGSGSAVCSPPSLARKRGYIWQPGDVNTIIIEHSSASGYFGEVMHSVFIGPPSSEVLQAFEVISQAQQLAGRTIMPGIPVGTVADEIDAFIQQHGFYGQHDIGQVLGHGQGLDIAEFPMLKHGEPTLIAAGMRLNIHPVISLSCGTSVVSTDCYVTTDTGARRLSRLSYDPVVQ